MNADDNSDNKKTRIFKANHLLQAKVGGGPVDEKLVKKSQKIIDESPVDFVPMAREYLAELEKSIDAAQKKEKSDRELLDDLIAPVMQLKANAAMFDYELVSRLSNIILNFLEMLETVNKESLQIVDAHHKAVILIVGNEMKGDGGEYGRQIAAELKEACKRYFAKQASAGKIIDDEDPFFIDG